MEKKSVLILLVLFMLEIVYADSGTYEIIYKYRFYFLIAAIIFLIAIFIMITIAERSYKRKMFADLGEFSRRRYYKNMAEKMKKDLDSDPERQVLEEFDKLVKEFFQEFLKVHESLTYEEISDQMKARGLVIASNFCNSMSNFLFSNEPHTKHEMIELLDTFQKIIGLPKETEKPKQEKNDEGEIKKHNSEIMAKAKQFVDEARLKNYPDESLIKLFRNKGWPDNAISFILKSRVKE